MTVVRVISDTWGRKLLTLVLVVAALLPLQNNVLPRILSVTSVWPDWSFLLGVLLLTFYVWVFLKRKVTLDTRVIVSSLLLTVLLLIAGLIGINRADPFTLYRFVVLIWSVPFLGLLMRDVAWRIMFLSGLVAVLLLHTQWGMLQFVVQHDLQLQLLGESRIAFDIDGVAKFAIADYKLIRAYGPYPHSNSLGGALIVGLVLLSLLLREKLFVSLRYSRSFVLISASLFALGILFTFSRAAYVGFALWLILSVGLFYQNQRIRALVYRIFLISLLLFIVFLPLLHARFIDVEDVALAERFLGLGYASEIIEQNSVWRGVGVGGYVPSLSWHLLSNNVFVQNWQLAPIHSVPMLMIAELGWVVSLMLFLWLAKSMWRVGILGLLLFSLLPMLLLDHYFYSQTALGLWFVVVLVSLVMSNRVSS